MSPSRIITFTSDFGTRETYVGQMHGAALSVCPEASLVDLTHEVPPHDIGAGAFLLATGCASFPRGTIHVAVVDPGVGTSRRGVVVSTDRCSFIAPDNGLLSRVLEDDPAQSAYILEATPYRREGVSSTFEGRDVFAPAAGWLARGVDPSNFGPPAGELVRLPGPPRAIEPDRPLRVRVLIVDRFGNATLDLPRRLVESAHGATLGAVRLAVTTPGGVVSDLLHTYGDREGSEPFLLFNSADHLEIAVREGRAADRLGLVPGAEVEVRLLRP